MSLPLSAARRRVITAPGSSRAIPAAAARPRVPPLAGQDACSARTVALNGQARTRIGRRSSHVAGVPVSRGFVHTALLGIAAFVLYAVFGVIVLRTDWPLATLGRAAQGLWNRITRGRRPVTGLDTRLLAERDTIRAVRQRPQRHDRVRVRS